MFEPGRDGPTAVFDEPETALLRRLISQYLSVLDAGPSSPDPVMARLYPSASLDDEAVASTFRDLTVDDLDASKRSNAESALGCLGESGPWEGPVSPEQVDAWLALLTDLRLIIGVRESVTEETMEKKLDPRDPAHTSLVLLHYLGALQEDLIQAIQEPA